MDVGCLFSGVLHHASFILYVFMSHFLFVFFWERGGSDGRFDCFFRIFLPVFSIFYLCGGWEVNLKIFQRLIVERVSGFEIGCIFAGGQDHVSCVIDVFMP